MFTKNVIKEVTIKHKRQSAWIKYMMIVQIKKPDIIPMSDMLAQKPNKQPSSDVLNFLLTNYSNTE